jgi:hypothetical protein
MGGLVCGWETQPIMRYATGPVRWHGLIATFRALNAMDDHTQADDAGLGLKRVGAGKPGGAAEQAVVARHLIIALGKSAFP